ncbi:hypothetical protein [Anaeromyxobacter terrae]|uniref:hypothetical protein n=1 Tax=Anaeromyxobacter terrae TaxID=2925406 RepID=UPI001F57F563|nr:hypothetical protein [Anaeromyxobacter sp. SG22]
MTKFYLYGEEHEVFDTETPVLVEKGALVSSPARTFLLQEPDRKSAFVVFVGAGGEAYGLSVKATRLDDELAEHLVAQAVVVEAGKP